MVCYELQRFYRALLWWPHQLHPHHIYSVLASPIVCSFYQQKFTPWKLCCGLGFMLTPSGIIKATTRIVTDSPLSTAPAYWNPQGRLCDNTALETCIPEKTRLCGWKKSTISLHNVWVQMWPPSLGSWTWKNASWEDHVKSSFSCVFISKQRDV